MTEHSLHLISFGYKYDEPQSDLTFDLRHLPNPYWEEDLSHLTGLDEPVIAFFEENDEVITTIHELAEIIGRSVNKNALETRVAVGCTGGQHRSVFAVEKLAKQLSDHYPALFVVHREQSKW